MTSRRSASIDPEHRWSYLVFLQMLGKVPGPEARVGRDRLRLPVRPRQPAALRALDGSSTKCPTRTCCTKSSCRRKPGPHTTCARARAASLRRPTAAARSGSSLLQRAEFFFERCLADVTEFSTAHLHRPLVILCVYGRGARLFRKQHPPAQYNQRHSYDFGVPARFRASAGAAERRSAGARRRSRRAELRGCRR